MANYKLSYVPYTVEFVQLGNGFGTLKGIEEIYRSVGARNYVIIRVDLLEGLSDIIDIDVIRRYRDAIFSLVSNGVQVELLPAVLSKLSDLSEKLRIKFSEFLTFGDKEKSLYQSLMVELILAYRRTKKVYTDFCSETELTFVAESDGYAYIGVPDTNGAISFPKDIEAEVLRDGKVWECVILYG